MKTTPAKANVRNAAYAQPPVALKPLVIAVLTALPLLAQAQSSKVPKLPAPSAAAIPVPSAAWRVYGTGSAAPTERRNAKGGVDQTIRQDSPKAIYQWNSFDIGANSSVTFDMARANASALNRVVGSANPSRIFGKLSATNGGEIYLINQNGILFGKGAQVNVGSLIASALDVSDKEFRASLIPSITSGELAENTPFPAFSYKGTDENFVDEKNFVRVESGARIVSGEGGRVFLFAKRVENAGRIETPGGQTVLGAGGEVYLSLPTTEEFARYYASEANPEVPALRGLVVELNHGPGDVAGSAWNAPTGQIWTPRGNTTIVGMAVNQSGRVTATTTVSENGSIVLRAQGGVDRTNSKKTALQAGQLVLGPSSVTEVLPDTAVGADGKAATSNDNAVFTRSRIDMTGLTVELQDGAQVLAPGGLVRAYAETLPRYAFPESVPASPIAAGADEARITIGRDVLIDVSGTTNTVIDGSRNFITTELLVSNDLKDAPLQKDGLLYRSRATLDVRGESPILGDLSNYRAATERTVDERLSFGGTVQLVAEGGIAMHRDARIDLSGGRVRYTDAMVAPTQLMGSDGLLYDLNHADSDLFYRYAFNLQRGADARYDRWGIKVNYGNTLPARLEPGYVEGRDAGRLMVVAPKVALDGRLDALSTAGQRQLEGKDRASAPGQIELGMVRPNASSGQGAVLQSLTLANDAQPALDEAFWDSPLLAPLPDASQISLATLKAGGFGSVDAAAEGSIEIDTGARGFELPVQGQLRLHSITGSVTADGRITAPAGRVELSSDLGAVALTADSRIDVSGRWINQYLGGQPLDTRATRAGDVVLSGVGVSTGAGSLINVSGGAAVSVNGKSIAGGNAGSIQIASRPSATPDAAPVALEGRLVGYAMADGGQLSISVPSVRISDKATEPASASTPSLTLGSAFFQQGGFSSFAIDGQLDAEIAADARIRPQRDMYVAPALNAQLVPTGQRALSVGRDPMALPGRVDLAFTSSGSALLVDGIAQGGSLRMQQGARIDAVPQSSVQLAATRDLRMDGAIVNHGGDVTLTLAVKPSPQDYVVPNVLRVGERSLIDVSGVERLTPTDTGLRLGEVLKGGTVTLNADSARASSLVWAAGGKIDVRGGSGSLDVAEQAQGAVRTTRQTVASDGGSLNVVANRDLRLDGNLRAQGGGPRAAGGRLDVSLSWQHTEGRNPDVSDSLVEDAPPPAERVLRISRLQSGPASTPAPQEFGPPPALLGDASVSAQLVRESGVADFVATGLDGLLFEPGVALNLARSLTLNTRSVRVDSGSTPAGVAPTAVSLAAPTVRLRNPFPLDVATSIKPPRPLPSATNGNATLTIRAHDAILEGRVATQGLGTVGIAATGDLRLQNPNLTDINQPEGALVTQADLNLSAARIYPASNTRYVIDAAGKAVTFARADLKAPDDAPLAAGGTLIVQAGSITQGGVLRAPQGRIELRAQDTLTLEDRSITSVSAEGKTILYGSFDNDRRWYAPGVKTTMSAPPAKEIVLDAPTGSIDVRPGSTLDLSGGGHLLASQFVFGPGGSRDVFTGGDGSFAIVPTVRGFTPYDPGLTANAPALGKQIVIGAGGPLPPGRYTLLPARYALLEGGFLVRPEAGAGPALVNGTVLPQTDGSSIFGARLADAGTAFIDAQASNWRITPQSVALKYSEIRTADASSFFNRLAEHDGVPVPRLPVDAGTLTLSAATAQLNGTTRFDVPKATKGEIAGRAGIAQIAADRIRVVGGSAETRDGALNLSANQLSNLGAGTLLLGAQRGAVVADESGKPMGVALKTTSTDVTIDTGGDALKVNDLVVAARDRVSVSATSTIEAQAMAAGGIESYVLEGDGAALRAAPVTGAVLTRTGVVRSGGQLSIEDGARLGAAGGTLVMDATLHTELGRRAQVSASDMTLSAGKMRISMANAAPQGSTTMVLGPALTRQFANVDDLTLRAYDGIDFADGSALTLAPESRLTFDTPRLGARDATDRGASVSAGTIAFNNSTGTRWGLSNSHAGRLTLKAQGDGTNGGRIEIGDGAVSIAGNARLVAPRGVDLIGTGTVQTGGSMTLQTPLVSASSSLADVTLKASGALQLRGVSATSAPDAAAAAALALVGKSVDVATAIALPAGLLSIEATGASADSHVRFARGASVDVSGRRIALGPEKVDVGAGTIAVTAAAGDIALNSGATLNANAVGSGAAGRIQLVADQGDVLVNGALQGRSASGAIGGQLMIDSRGALDLARLSGSITQEGESGFRDRIAVHSRQGDLTVDARTGLTAREISLQADGGALRVAGSLNADGSKGGTIALAARDDLTLASGAYVSAQALKSDRAGGRVELYGGAGAIRIESGSTIDVSGRGRTDEGKGGRVLLRAARTGVSTPTDAGTDVNIAPIDGAIRGAGRIDVEAVKVYDASTVDYTLMQQIATDGLGFLGANGANAGAIAGRLAANRAETKSVLRVHAGAEVRSSTDISYAHWGDWLLPTESTSLADPHVGDTSLTLRAAGHVYLPKSIGAGYDTSAPYLDQAAAVSHAGGSIRIAAGADMSAADPMRTLRGAVGDVVFGPPTNAPYPSYLQVATTTGDVSVSAARDVNLHNTRVGIYSYGTAAPAADTADAAAQLQIDPTEFRVDGGNVEIRAGRDVLARSATYLDGPGGTQYYQSFWDWRTTALKPVTELSPSQAAAWWGDRQGTELFTHGIATMAGGDVTVDAGRNVGQLQASTASSGYWTRASEDVAPAIKRYEAGDLHVFAARDIVNGTYFGAGDQVTLRAGRDIRRNPIRDDQIGNWGTELVYENTASTVSARRHVELTNARSAFSAQETWLWGLDGDARLDLVAGGGSLTFAPRGEGAQYSYISVPDGSYFVPAYTTIAAPQGSLTVGGQLAGLIQQPTKDGSLRLLSRDDISLTKSVLVRATRSTGLGYLTANGLSTPLYEGAHSKQQFADSGVGLDVSSRDPVRIVAAEGDILINSDMRSARPVQMTAGGDIAVSGPTVFVQHQARRWDAETRNWVHVGELSFMHAGRDVLLQSGADIQVLGGGHFVALAGRDIDLGTDYGLMSSGNINSPTLPSGGAHLTLVAGLRADGVDYAEAVRKGFHALGGLGLTDRAGDLYAQLSTPDRLVSLNSTQARQFNAEPLETQLSLTRALVGTRFYDTAIAGYVRGLPGNESLSTSQALAQFDRLSPGVRSAAPGAVLAESFAERDAALRIPFVAQIAAIPPKDKGPNYATMLVEYLKRTTGTQYDLADALARFEALPLERQVPLMNQVLVEDLRTNGRAATQASGDAQALAYARGYRAIDMLFPVDRPEGDINLSTSQVRTLQRGSIRLMAPGGSVNAGETSFATGDPTRQGIVTNAGGNITSVVRDDFLVNRSRVFTLGLGNILIWASQGDIDAGRGAKTLVGAAVPVLRFIGGKLVLDSSGSFSGSGIAVLNADSSLDLYAPQGAIDAGEAGIRASGNAFFGAQVIRGADDIQVGGISAGVPPAPPTSAGIAGLDSNLQAAANKAVETNDSEEERRRRRAQRQLLLEFLGYGQRS